MLINFDTFSGLAPAEGERTKTATRAITCTNANLRRGDIRPLRVPITTSRSIDANPTALVENQNTGTVFSGVFGDGLVVDQFRAGGLAYAVIGGVKQLLAGDTTVGPYFPERPTTAPTVDVTLTTLGATYNIGDELDAISAVESPVNNVTVPDPRMIAHHRSTNPATYEFPPATILAATDWVADNYILALPDPRFAHYTFRDAISTMVNLLDTKPTLSRIWNVTPDIQSRVEPQASAYTTSVEEALRGTISAMAQAVVRELTGSWPGLLHIAWVCPLQLESPEDTALAWVLNTVQSVDVTAVPGAGPYTAGAGVVLQYASATLEGLAGVAQYVGGTWRHNNNGYTTGSGFDAVREVFNLSMIECAAARAAPTTYVWYGLYGSSFTSTGALQPFVPGVDTLHPNTEEYSAPVPRAYCYTWIDQWGRESRPSEPVVVTGQNELGSAATHTVTCPNTAPSSVALVALYRMSVPHEAADADALTGAWVRVAMVTPLDAAAGIGLSDVGDAGYAVLETVLDEPHPDTPKFLCATEAGHSVCTNAARDTVFISKRHIHWSFPFNRRLNMPIGLTVENIKVVADTIYVATNDYPIVIVTGEDKADEGLQLQIHHLTHAKYNCVPKSMVSTGWGVLLWTDVGLLALAGVNATVASITLIDDDQASAYSNIPCAAYQHGMYFMFQDDGGVFLFDTPDPTFGETVKAPLTHATVTAYGAVVTQNGELLLAQPDYEFLTEWDWSVGTMLPITYRTYLQKLPHDHVFTAVKVHGEGVSGLLACYDVTGLRWSRVISGDTPVRCLPIRIKGAVSLRFEGQATYISNFELASSMGELGSL